MTYGPLLTLDLQTLPLEWWPFEVDLLELRLHLVVWYGLEKFTKRFMHIEMITSNQTVKLQPM